MTGVRIAAAARCAVRGVEGELARWHPVALGAVVGSEALKRAQTSPEHLDEVIVGCADPVGACGADAARAVALAAGWPFSVGGQVIDRGETSGMAAVQAGVAAIRSCQADTVLVVGMGLASTVPPGAAAVSRGYGTPWAPVAERLAAHGGLLPQPRLAERAARAAGMTRDRVDAAAQRSRRRREDAVASAALVAVEARPRSTASELRPGRAVTRDALRDWGDAAALPPVFDDDGLLSAAGFAPPADGVAAMVLQADDAVMSQGDARRARLCAEGPPDEGVKTATVLGAGRAADDPFDPTGGVVTAVQRALDESGVTLSELDEICVNELDAATLLLVSESLGLDEDRVNRSGGALATGHAGPAEELRLMTDALACGPRRGALLLTVGAAATGSAAILFCAG